jgi:hypothetical protein
MTAKELLLKEARCWSDHDAEIALRAVEREHREKPDDLADEWGHPSATSRAATAAMLKRMDESESAEGFSWDEHR